jgi:hypothetical protein
MQRREILRYLGAAVAVPFLPKSAEALAEISERLARQPDVSFATLDKDQQALVTEIAEMIIPETDTPGATSVKVPQFIDLLLTEWAADDDKKKFLDGLADIDAKAAALGVMQQSQSQKATRFVELPAASKHDLLTTLDGMRGDQSGAGLAFSRLKSLTVYGYFTSKKVDVDVLKTQMFFDGYHGNVPFTPAV